MPGVTVTQAEELRELLGCNRVEYARVLGVDFKTITRWESADDDTELKGTVGRLVWVLLRQAERCAGHHDRMVALRQLLTASAQGGGLGIWLDALLAEYLDHRTRPPSGAAWGMHR